MQNNNHGLSATPIKIVLGDLRHKTAGKHSFLMPIGIGYIASYTLAQMAPEEVEIRLYDDTDSMLKDINDWQPTVIALTNYCWNTELSQTVFEHAKKMNPSVICIAGGPNFPTDHGECKEYLLKRPDIDFYVYFEGEVGFSQLIKKIQKGFAVSSIKSEPQGNTMSIHPQTKELVFGSRLPRLKNLDEIPSPYLAGLMDQWFDGSYAPCIETARGCPFTCAYCFVGSQDYYRHLATFSIERIKEELTFIAQKISKYPGILLAICDSDFGMYERDEETARHIRSLQDKFNWPNAFIVDTGKANYDRILKVASILQNRMYVTCSVQTLNPKSLAVIKRKNPSTEEYRKINTEVKKRGMGSITEVIVPLPEETKSSFFEGLKFVTNVIGVDKIVPYTLMLLKGTYLASRECREKYHFKTKYRIIPRQFGEYLGKKCFEIEEVCISTNTISFDDYLEIRGYSLVSAFFSDKQFDVIHRHLKELEISRHDYFYHLWETIKSGQTALSEIYICYLKENSEELWNSKEEIYEHFSQKDNYKKLLSGELGDNLLRKYKTEILLKACLPSIELSYSCLEDIAQNVITSEISQSLSAAKNWMIAIRNVSALFKDKQNIKDDILNLTYDVNRWYLDGVDSKPLTAYFQPVKYKISYQTDRFESILTQTQKLYGGDISFQLGKLLIDWDIEIFWCQCKPLK